MTDRRTFTMEQAANAKMRCAVCLKFAKVTPGDPASYAGTFVLDRRPGRVFHYHTTCGENIR